MAEIKVVLNGNCASSWIVFPTYFLGSKGSSALDFYRETLSRSHMVRTCGRRDFPHLQPSHEFRRRSKRNRRRSNPWTGCLKTMLSTTWLGLCTRFKCMDGFSRRCCSVHAVVAVLEKMLIQNIVTLFKTLCPWPWLTRTVSQNYENVDHLNK